MKNFAVKWWKKRLDRYYLKKRWHIIADIILISVILTLLAVFIFLNYFKTPWVDTRNVPHIPKEEPSQAQQALVVEVLLGSNNIRADKDFNLKITLSNNGKRDIDNINLGLSLSSNKFSFSKIKAYSDTEGLKVSGRKILGDKLKAGESKELVLVVSIKNLPDSARLVTWRLNGEYQQGGSVHKFQQALPDLKLVSSLNVKAAAYYNSPLGDQLGSGPIPPQAGIPTNYWIFFNPENIGNNLSGFMVSGVLPENVDFYGQKSLTTGQLSYNEKQRRITWAVPNLSPDNGKYQAAFELQIIPSPKQIGKRALLLSDVVFSAHDSYTGEDLSGRKQPIDTELPFDPINKGDGLVKE